MSLEAELAEVLLSLFPSRLPWLEVSCAPCWEESLPVLHCPCSWRWAMSPTVAVYLKSSISAVDFLLPVDTLTQLCTAIPCQWLFTVVFMSVWLANNWFYPTFFFQLRILCKPANFCGHGNQKITFPSPPKQKERQGKGGLMHAFPAWHFFLWPGWYFSLHVFDLSSLENKLWDDYPSTWNARQQWIVVWVLCTWERVSCFSLC